MDVLRVIREEDLADAGQTAGMIRKTAFADPGIWVGVARTEPGATSGWHHHGGHTTYLYCVAGVVRMESGPGGGQTAEARAGEFMVVPAATVHRESNPTDVESIIVLTRVGVGPVVINVDGPPGD